jgi:phosphoglycolate phosphatase
VSLPRAILFDWDNTLCDSYATIGSAINATRKKYGMPEWDDSEVLRFCTRPAREVFPEWFGDKASEAQDFFYSRFEAEHLTGVKPLPLVEESLKKIHELGIVLCVVSNKRGDLLRAEVEKLGWKELFVSVVGSCDADQDKPSAKTVELALSGTGIDPAKDEVWFVGDSEIDINTGKNAGCKTVLIGSESEGKKFGALRIFSDCVNLYQWVYNHSKQSSGNGQGFF